MRQLSKTEILEKIQRQEITPEQGVRLFEQIAQPAARLYYGVGWESAALEPAADRALSGSVLVLGNDAAFRDALQAELGASQAVILVQPGREFQQLGDLAYAMDPARTDDYKRLMEALDDRRLLPQHVIHMWASQQALPEQLQQGVHSLLHVIQAMMARKRLANTNVLFVHPSLPAYAAVSALAKTARLENPGLTVKTIECTQPSAAWIKGELLDDQARDVQIRYENGARYAKRLQEQQAPAEGSLPLKQHGVYLITGGLGGLGLLFAEHLANSVQARLVLSGRSALTEQTEQLINRLQEQGAEVLYVQADISQREDVQSLLAAARSRFGVLDGIVHSAGVIRDAFLLKQTAADLDLVLAPKVYGTLHLDELTRDEPLDFFVLFSSISAVTGNLGQSGYAFANSFMDHLAEQRELLRVEGKRSGKSLAFNWPFWAEGGMEVDAAVTEEMKRSAGLIPLRTPTGIAAFEDGLRASRTQWLVVEGDEQAMRARLSQKAASKPRSEAPSNVADDSLVEKTEAYLKQVLSKTTKLPLHKLDAHVELEEYGIDSVMVMGLTRELENDFGELSKTLFFEYQNLADLAAYFAAQHADTLRKLLGTSVPERTPARVEQPAAAEQPAEQGLQPIARNTRQRFLGVGSAGAEASPAPEEDDIAIIGVSGRYPMANDIWQYWDNLKNGRDCISEIPDGLWDHSLFYDPDKEKKGKVYSKWGGFLDDYDKFDPLFFNISPREAETLDPQERLFLETVYHAIEDGGYTKTGLNKANVGVFVGVMYGQYQLLGVDGASQGDIVPLNSSYASIANRVSYSFNFHGPSMAVDTMCSSSLTSIHLACTSLRRGESELAIAGGVNITIHPHKFVVLSQGKFAASDGRCRTFGEGGDGYVPGDGVGAVLLKPLKKAQADGDRIYAVIKATSVNHGGKTNGFTVPNPNAQADVIADALKKAKIDPRSISYIEAHGTGTSLGDPIEITGLVKAFRQTTQDKQYCSIGSAKSNIGHLESAAGIAGVTKVLLQMKHKQLAPSLHSETLNPNINFQDSPFYVQRDLASWKQPTVLKNGSEVTIPRRAGVSSFGAGGSNAHVILEEYIEPATAQTDREEPQLILLSAKNAERLRTYAQNLLDFLKKPAEQQPASPTESDDARWLSSFRLDVLHVLSELLEVDASELAEASEISEYGLDPLAMTELANALNEKFRTDLSPSRLTELSTVDALAASLFEHYQPELQPVEQVDRSLRLCDIAYTLQVGRDTMEERLAVVAESVEDLYGQLQQFLDGQADFHKIYTGNVKTIAVKNERLVEGEEGRDFLQILIRNRKLEKLAHLWVSGVNIEWKPLHDCERAQIVSLPSYPFARERYWVPARAVNKPFPAMPHMQAAVAKLHPLIDRNTSTLREQRFASALRDALYVKDCALYGRTVLSGGALLEMARAAGAVGNETGVRKLQSLVIFQPLAVGEAGDVQMRLLPAAHGADWEMSFGRDVYAQARVVFDDGVHAQADALDLEAARIGCTTVMQAAEIQQSLQAAGWSLSAEQQVVQQLFIREGTALVKMELPRSLRNSQLHLHPALVDGALHAASVWLGQKQAHLLFAAQQVELYAPLPDSAYAKITLADQPSGDAVAVDILLTDAQGRPCARLQGAELAPVAQGQGLADVTLVKTWRESDATGEQARPTGKVIVLARAETRPLAQELLNGVTAAEAVVLEVDAAWSEAEAGKRAARDLLQSDAAFTGLIDLTDLHHAPVSEDQPSLGKMALLQEVIRATRLDVFRLLQVTNGLQTYEMSEPTLAGACFASVVRLLGAEYRKLTAKTIDIDLPLTAVAELRDILLTEWWAAAEEGEVCYRRGKRLAPEMHEAAAGPDAPLALDGEQVIVITGGTRGIGAEVAKHLAAKGARKLVLMGVQSFPPRDQWDSLIRAEAEPKLANRVRHIIELEKQGVRVELYAGSLTDRDALRAYFAGIRSRFGEIGGVIHCAGLTLSESSAFISKGLEDMQRVFEPKIEGLQVLHDIFREDPLRFFVLFSSVSGIVPPLASGGIDYGAANGFMDAFASYQRAQGQAHYRSIQWPSWKEVGFGEITSPAYTQLALAAHSTAEGLAMLDRAIAQGEHACVLPAMVKREGFDAARLLRTRQEAKQPQKPAAAPAVQTAKTVAATASNTMQKLKELFSAELKIPQDKLDDNTPFGDFGVDSILLVELVKQVEQWTGRKLDPSVMLEHPTFQSLAAHLREDDPTASSDPQPEPAEEPAQEPAQIVQQAPAEAARMNLPLIFAVGQPHRLTPLAPRTSASAAAAAPAPVSQKIAVIGMACHFPGATDKDIFWSNLTSGKSSVVEVPKSRWDADRLYSPVYEKGKIISKWGGFIAGIEQFDPGYFQISEEDAPTIDPLIRQFLEVSVQTLHDAGYEKRELWNRKIGVFVGSRVNNYSERMKQPSKNSVIGVGQNFIAAHVSHLFNFKGPNMVVDTACSSSLVSLHLACQSLLSGESEMALAGGVDILIDQKPYLLLSEGKALSPDGKCHTFDEKANGFVPGEGCGAVLLKPLERAIADGDRIYAVIESTAVNNDGHTMGITTPNPEAQVDVIRDSLQRGNISANSISYVETHGTGTMIGDPIELKALTRIFREYTEDQQYCAVGSVKTNFGHLLSAAGIASFIKVALSIYHKQLPPTLNCEKPNPRFKFDTSPFYPHTSLRDWSPREGTRRAGISSFGFGGTNAHIIVGEGDSERLQGYVPSRNPLPPVVFNRKRYWLDPVQPQGNWQIEAAVAREPIKTDAVPSFLKLEKMR